MGERPAPPVVAAEGQPPGPAAEGGVQMPGVASTTARRRPRRRGGPTPYVLVAPAVVLLVLFLLVPIGYTVWLSLRASRVSGGGLGLRVEKFVGLENYLGVFRDPG